MIDAPEPDAPRAGEILVGMELAPVNLHDPLVLQGFFPYHPELPSPAGNEGVGRVLAIGPDVSSPSVGDVVVLPLFGMTWRERLVVSVASVFAVPADADLEQLSMLRGDAVTATLLLDEYADLSPGDWVLQNAGNSAVVQSVTAIAKSRGLKTINLVRRPEVIDVTLASEADASFLDDEAAVEHINALVGQKGVKLAIDGVGGSAVGRLAAALSAGGIVVSYGTVGGDFEAKLSMVDAIFKDISYRGFYVDRTQYDAALPEIISAGAALIEAGKLRIPVAAVCPLEDIGKAIEHVQRGGKVLLRLNLSPHAVGPHGGG